ncbi:GNAT family N-acetyltransferase [Streptomyces sp. NPDC005438]|uniref:GNAT family N-acetyltransferase n=1 Tax=Streptomyces sp. NPDC005438 TaxID=3156880 RepID=UPI0033B8C55A
MTYPSSPVGPVLTTDRLFLRSWTPAEARAVREGRRYQEWAEDFPAEGDRVIAGLLDQHADWFGACGHRLVVERDGGLVVGSLGLFWPPRAGVVEIGYGVVPSRRGRGYAPEATRALVGLALAVPEVHTVRARVEGANPASVRVLERVGFVHRSTEDGTATYEATDDGCR